MSPEPLGQSGSEIPPLPLQLCPGKTRDPSRVGALDFGHGGVNQRAPYAGLLSPNSAFSPRYHFLWNFDRA
ncbi:unnamed protein product [Leuciscus chuanchicus]